MSIHLFEIHTCVIFRWLPVSRDFYISIVRSCKSTIDFQEISEGVKRHHMHYTDAYLYHSGC